MNFTTLGFIDVWELSCSLHGRVGLFPDGVLRVLPLRGPRSGADDPDDDSAYVQSKEAAKWIEARNTLARLKRLGDAAFGGIEFGRVFIDRLDPGVALPWMLRGGPYAERFTRIYVALRTNPATIHHSGTEGWHLQQGHVVAVNQRVPCSAINLGDHWSALLVVDCRRRDPSAVAPVMGDEA